MTDTTNGPAGHAFAGRVALVTGAGRGIGAAIAQALHQHGARVVVTDLEPELAQAVAAQLDPAGDTAMALTLDVRRKEDFEQALAATCQRWQQLDIVVNNRRGGHH